MRILTFIFFITYSIGILAQKSFQHFTINENNFRNFTQISQDLNTPKLYEMILPFMENQGQEQAENKLKDLLNSNFSFSPKMPNLSGFDWKTKFQFINVSTRREFIKKKNKILVQDLLELSIDAKSYLEKLKNDQIINISIDELNAFAGLRYHNIFKSTQEVDNLEQAHKLNFNLLLKPFSYLNLNDIKNIAQYSSIQNIHSFSLNAGINLSANFYYFLNLSANAGFEYSSLSENIFQIEELNQHKILHISKQNQQSISANLNTSFSLDFYNIIKLTLVDFGTSFQSKKSKTSHYQIPIDDILEQEQSVQASFNHFLINTNHIPDFLKFYWTGEENNESKSSDTHFRFLFWNHSKGSYTESSHVKSRSSETSFFSTGENKIKTNYNLVGGLLTGILGDWATTIFGTGKEFQHYSSWRLQMEQNEEYFHETFYGEIRNNFYLKKKNGFWVRKKSREFGQYLFKIPYVDPSLKNAWYQGFLYKDILLDQNYIIGENALSTLKIISKSQLKVASMLHCGVNSPNTEQFPDWDSFDWKTQQCIYMIYNKVLKLQEAKLTQEIQNHAKNFIKQFVKSVKNYDSLYYFFGKQNISSSTYIKAKNAQGNLFTGSYDDQNYGQIQLVDLFKRNFNVWYNQ